MTFQIFAFSHRLGQFRPRTRIAAMFCESAVPPKVGSKIEELCPQSACNCRIIARRATTSSSGKELAVKGCDEFGNPRRQEPRW